MRKLVHTKLEKIFPRWRFPKKLETTDIIKNYIKMLGLSVLPRENSRKRSMISLSGKKVSFSWISFGYPIEGTTGG